MQRKSAALVGVAVLAALVFALGAGSAGAAKHGPGGNSAAAKACQGTGYLDLVREDGTAFGTPGACVGYAARTHRAIQSHESILESIRWQDAERSRVEMEAHLRYSSSRILQMEPVTNDK